MTAINSCIEVDLTGQICSDSIGTRMYSGFGGQVDFIRGAAEALDGLGKPIIALPSVTNKGQSKISPFLKQGQWVLILFLRHGFLLLFWFYSKICFIFYYFNFILGVFFVLKCQNNKKMSDIKYFYAMFWFFWKYLKLSNFCFTICTAFFF